MYPLGAGAKMPTVLNGWDVSPGYGGRYLGESDSDSLYVGTNGRDGLGNFFDDLQKIAGKVGLISGELSNVASGNSDIATIPKNQATITLPMGGGIQKAVPLWVVGVGAAGLLFLAFRK